MSEKQITNLYRWIIGSLLSILSVVGGIGLNVAVKIQNTTIQTQTDVAVMKQTLINAIENVKNNQSEIEKIKDWRLKFVENQPKNYIEQKYN